MVYNNQLVSIKGQVQREPWKDREGLPTNYLGDEYFGVYAWECSESSIGFALFVIKYL